MGKGAYYYQHDGRRQGPVSSHELRHLASIGELLAEDLVWREGRPNGVPAGQIPGLFKSASPAALKPSISCPSCGQALVIQRLEPGRSYECPFCRQPFSLPTAVPTPRTNTPVLPPPIAPIIRQAPRETIHRYGLAHKARETFQHAFGGSFGIALGWSLGKFVAGLIILMVCFGGCVIFGWFASHSLDATVDKHLEVSQRIAADAMEEGTRSMDAHLKQSRQDFQRQLESPAHNSEDTAKFIEDQPTQEEPQAIFEITWREIDAIYNLKHHRTDLQKEEAWKNFQGQRVEWTGEVSAINVTFGTLSLHVRMNAGTFTSDVLVQLRPSEKSKAVKLSEGNTVTFRGTLDSWGGAFLPTTLDDGEIVDQ